MGGMDGCAFREILAGGLPASVVFRDEHCTAFMDIMPINPGHVLVVPNRHAASLAEFAEDAGTRVFGVGQRIAAALHGSDLRCEGINLPPADGAAAGQEVFHAHLHVAPRFDGDGFGLVFGPHYGDETGRKELDALADRVRGAL